MRLKLLDDPVRILRIIFGNKCFNTGRIKRWSYLLSQSQLPGR